MQGLQKNQSEARIFRLALRLILTAGINTLLLTNGCAVVSPHERNFLFVWQASDGATHYRLNRSGLDLPAVTNCACPSAVAKGDVFTVRAFNATTNSPPSNAVKLF